MIIRGKSIRRKLMQVLLLASSSTLVISISGFTISDWFSHQESTIERLRAVAGIIGSNSEAALTFEDTRSVQRTLSILKEEADIAYAAVYDDQGMLLASYQRDDSVSSWTLPFDESGYIDGEFYAVLPIILEGAPIGSILIVSDQTYWKQRQLFHLFTVLGVLLISFVVALLISRRLQRAVTDPVLKLAETARHITRSNDYSMRAKKISTDEIGLLADDFNSMLDQIQVKDNELQKVTEQLEVKVEARTQALTELTRQLEHQAYHDSLTGLANRTTFDNHLRLAIEQLQRYGGQLAVLFLDLDRFKVVNDTLGHVIGDRLLIQVAKRFTTCMRASDTLARLGGDEFAVLLKGIHSTSDAADVAQKLQKVIAEPIEVDGYSLHPATSIGISLFPSDGDDAEILLKNADTAMYRSKDAGRNQITFFSADMNVRARRRLELENKLRQAVKEQALQVYYQPRCDAETMDITGVEALARWTDPEEGEIAPSEFIPLAEECGLIGDIDEWVLKKACSDVLQWFDGDEPEIGLAVNFSPTQFARKDPHAIVKQILLQTGFPATSLELEVTESLFGPDSFDITNTFKKISELGVEISVDDFGTAYSSLSRLKQLPLHTLKIDQSFVRDLGKDPDDETIVRTIITMAHSLNLKVVAEGVETHTQYEFVRQHGCDEVQGYLFGRPVPAAEIESLLAARGADDSSEKIIKSL
jgi:diguanylate cyclase (GGDEF)-like protein